MVEWLDLALFAPKISKGTDGGKAVANQHLKASWQILAISGSTTPELELL